MIKYMKSVLWRVAKRLSYIEDARWWPATSWVCYTTSCNTQSSAPENGQNNCPKHVELTGIVNNPLFLHLVGCLYFITLRDLLNNLNLFL